jgi:hypothetical protein
MSMTLLSRYGMLVVGSDDSKIRFFDVATLRHDLTFDCEGCWPVAMIAFDFQSDDQSSKGPDGAGRPRDERQGAVQGFAWGDNGGVLHMMLDYEMAELRTQNEVVPFFRNTVAHHWDIPVFGPRAEGRQGRGARGGAGAGAAWFSVLSFVGEVGLQVRELIQHPAPSLPFQ